MKKMVQSKMKDVPAEEQAKIMKMLEKNPEFFMKIAKEIQDKMSGGKDQMAAAMEVMQAHGEEIKKIMAS